MSPDDVRPLLRGWSHAAAVLPALAGAGLLLARTRSDTGRFAAVLVYGVALVLLFTVSALYHRVGWPSTHRALWRRLDHATIFVMIAGTYTPVAVVVLDGAWRIGVLAAVWVAAVAGAVLVTTPLRLPRPLTVSLYLGVGWIAVAVTPVLYVRLGAGMLALLLTGGVLYSIGATIYALQRPRLWPRVFGYHEVFHLLVIAASAVFFLFIALSVTPAARA